MSGLSLSVLQVWSCVVVGVAGMALEWKQEEIMLISLYEEYPVLWNTKLTEYKEQHGEELAYGEIQEVLKNDIGKIAVEQIRGKYTYTAKPI